MHFSTIPLRDVLKTLQEIGVSGRSRAKEGKRRHLREVSVCFDKARDFRSKIALFGLRAPRNVFPMFGAGGGGGLGRFTGFLCAMPETTVFVVVSGTHTHTGVVLAHVAETTSFIVVLGT